MIIRVLLISLISMFFIGCNGGLDPTQTQTTVGHIKGVIHYTNGKDLWPSADSVKDIRVVAFKNYPPIGILEEVLGGTAFYTMESLPFFVDSANFDIEIAEPPITIKYLVVAQQFAGVMDWRAIGVLNNSSPSSPTEFTINFGETKYFNINVDFNNLPPQPFK
jgi:hypothetical protein